MAALAAAVLAMAALLVAEAHFQMDSTLGETYKRLSTPCMRGRAAWPLARARRRLEALPEGGGRDAAARKWLLEAAEACREDAAVLDEVGEGLRMLWEPALAMSVYTCAVQRGVWRHPLQRVLHNFEPGLHSMALLAPEALENYPELQKVQKIFERHWRRLAQEFEVAKKHARDIALLTPCPGERVCWAKTFHPEVHRWHDGIWRQYSVMRKYDSGNIGCLDALHPLLCTLLSQVVALGLEPLQMVVSQVDGPRTYIPMHRSARQDRIRLNCAVHVPTNGSSVLRFPNYAELVYKSGKCFWFDESYEHDLLHEGPTRSSVILDVAHPGLDGRPIRGEWTRSKLAAPKPDGQDCEAVATAAAARSFRIRRGDLVESSGEVTAFLRVVVEMRSGLPCATTLDPAEDCLQLLQVREGEEPLEAVVAFVRRHGLNAGDGRTLLDFVGARLPYHAGVKQPWLRQHGEGKTASSLLLYLQRRFGYSSYAEVGCGGGEPLEAMRGGFPGRTACVDLRAAASAPASAWDMVLLHGYHTGHRALEDVRHALASLSSRGAVLLGGCNPNSASQASEEHDRATFFWLGDVFRAVVELRRSGEVDVVVGDFDFGVAVLLPRERTAPLVQPRVMPAEVWNMSYADFAMRRRELLHLLPWEGLVDWIG